MTTPLLPAHGGYRRLKSFQLAQLAFDLTVLFVKRYVDRFSRTCDQMTQAAREWGAEYRRGQSSLWVPAKRPSSS